MLCFRHIDIPAIYRFLFDCTILCHSEAETRNIILMKLYKEVILEPALDLAESIAETLQELIDNFEVIANLRQTICNIFDKEYFREILSLIRKNQNHEL